MRNLWIIGGIILVIIGVGGLASQDWSFSGNKVNVEKKWKVDAGTLKDLSVKSEDPVRLSFVKSEDGTDSVTLKGEIRKSAAEAVENAAISGGKLELDLRDKGFRFLVLDFSRKEQEIVVAIADGAQLESLKLGLDSGRGEVTDARAGTMEISVDSGSLSVNNVTAGELTLESDSGSIKGDGIHAENSDVSAESGSVKLVHLTGAAKIEADSGRVELCRDDTAPSDIKVDSGSVYVQVPASFAGSFDLRADSGRITAPEPKRETTDYVKVRTDSGSIKIEQQ